MVGWAKELSDREHYFEVEIINLYLIHYQFFWIKESARVMPCRYIES